MGARSRLVGTVMLVVVLVIVVSVLFSSCQCAPTERARTTLLPGAAPLPTGFALAAPWESGERHRIIRGYNVATHTGVDRPLRTNDAYALDFDLDTGDAVLPVAPGRVRFAGEALGGFAGFGNIVLIDHVHGISSLYAHLDSVAVDRGAMVSRQTQLGHAGGSGEVRPHLHLALYRNVRLADDSTSAGPYGGVSVLPEPFAADHHLGLARGQCIESGQQGAGYNRRRRLARV